MSAQTAAPGSGKTHRDENFPVASFVIHPKHRGIILAFYRFARAADDIADDAGTPAGEKLRLLETMRRTMAGESDASREALVLREALDARGLNPVHALDLLEAFRRDVTKLRYANFTELMEYCRYSAMPVGRFVLDVHGERQAAWPASDALCAALQIINHVQDCAKDFRALNRVYLPLDAFAAAGIGPEALGAAKASPALLDVLHGVVGRTQTLLKASTRFPRQIESRRLSFEVSVIQTLAEDLARRLLHRDPLSERVHHRKLEALALIAPSAWRFAQARLGTAAS